MFGDTVLMRASGRARAAILIACPILLAAAILATATRADAEPNPATITSAVRIAPRVVELTIDTPAFAKLTKVHVDLPTGYDDDPTRLWPTTYFLAGTQNTYRSFNSVLSGVALTEDYPSIVISPNGDSGYWSDWYNRGNDGPPRYETYVIDQLIPLIDGYFRTLPNRADRAIGGVSMGGYGALMLAARHPDLFASAASVSGTLNSNLPLNAAAVSVSSALQGADVDAIYGPRLTQEVRWRGHNPADLAENLSGIDLQVRTANGSINPRIGENPFSVDLVSCLVEAGVHDSSVSMHGILDRLGVAHRWKDYGAGCHTTPNFKREVADTLRVFAQNFTQPKSPPADVDYESMEPEFDVWGWHIAADSSRPLEFLRIADSDSTGISLTGSGTTTVTTPPIYRGRRFVRLAGATTEWVTADDRGRITFSVDLGHTSYGQQFRLGSRTLKTTQAVDFFPLGGTP